MSIHALDYQLCASGRYYRHKRKEDIKALLFGFLLIAIFCLSLSLACMSSGTIILGTELNTNGQVEYLCLGNGCENLNGFSWNDK